MSKKDKFIKIIQAEIFDKPDIWAESYPDDFADAALFFEAIKGTVDKEKPAFTENGKLVLRYLQENHETYNNLFKAKDVGDGLNITSRTASGAMRKLVNDGYIEKMSENPVVYAITEKGLAVDLDAES